MHAKAVLTSAVLASALCTTVFGFDNGLGLTPPMGWNTWKTCGDDGCTHGR